MKDLCTIWQFATAHAGTLAVGAAVLWTAFSSTVPEDRPKTLDDFWAWFRDFVHQAGNVRRPTMPKL